MRFLSLCTKIFKTLLSHIVDKAVMWSANSGLLSNFLCIQTTVSQTWLLNNDGINKLPQILITYFRWQTSRKAYILAYA